MKKVKSLHFIHQEENPLQKKSKIDPQRLQNIQFKFTEGSKHNQNLEDNEFSFRQTSPRFTTNIKSLTPYIQNKIQKLKCWQQKQKQLVTRLEAIRQQKVVHLQNTKKIYKYSMPNSQMIDIFVPRQRKVNPIKININNEVKLKANKKQVQNQQIELLKKISVISTEENQDSSSVNIQKIMTGSMKNKSNSFYKIKYSFVTKSENSKKQNQDSHFQITTQKNTRQLSYFGVCDGHGKYGKQISNFISQKLPLILQQIYQNDTQFGQKSLRKTYDKILIELYETQINIQRSGSTLNCCAIKNNILYMMNIGDSRCIMGYKHSTLKWETQSFLEDHTLKNQKEALRIIKCNGNIKQCTVNGKQVGPFRIWNQRIDNQKYYGITMTRSIGDACLASFGISRRAQFMAFHFDDISARGQKIIVIGTDGLYQNLQNTQIIEFVSMYFDHGKTVEQATQQLLKLAYKKNKQLCQQSDDITIIILFIE